MGQIWLPHKRKHFQISYVNAYSLLFDGVDEKVTIGNDSSNWPADTTDEFSVSFWVKSPVESDNRSVCFQRSVTTGAETGFKIYYNIISS